MSAIQTKAQSEIRPRSSEAPASGDPPQGTGRLILLWYAALALAALFCHWAMDSQSAVLSAALAGAAIAIPLVLLAHTMRSYGAVLNSHILVPAIGPMVILVLILEYVEYNRHLEDAHSAELIPAELLSLSDVKWAGGKAGAPGRLSGHVANRSPHELVGMSIQLMLLGGQHRLDSVAEARVDVAPGQQGDFAAPTPHVTAAIDMPCVRADPAAPEKPKNPGGLRCFYRVIATRGEEVFF
jgi:hypothetical protein